jgi:hypothetical protein
MIFTLKSYNDLGRCSYATLKETFDTEKDEILLNGNKVEIKKIEDLFPFLWTSAGIAVHTEGKSRSQFFSTGTHWHHDFDESIAKQEKYVKRRSKAVDKMKDGPKKEKAQKDLAYIVQHIEALKRICKRCDEEMEELKQKLIEENKGN